MNDAFLIATALAGIAWIGSPDSFSRAFKNLHGVTPAEARSNGIE
ncbi:hypothetical protein [Bacillus sp. C1]